MNADPHATADAVLDQIERVVVGKRDALELVLVGILAGAHVLLEDYPGLGKTLIARSFAQAMGLSWRRVQFTPDLLPADITGASVYDRKTGDFTFRSGPIFTNLLLADEINRTPPKTQAALLEAMQEQQVSVDGVSHPLASPFTVLATSNPIEYEGTYPLPEAQVDRFLLRIGLGYPSGDDEWHILANRMARRHEEMQLDQVCDVATVLALREAVENVTVEETVGRYMVDLVAATRAHPQVLVGASPRGSLALLLASRCRAMLGGRDFVTPDDVKAVAVAALAHRLTLRAETWLRGATTAGVVESICGAVAVPPTAVPAPR